MERKIDQKPAKGKNDVQCLDHLGFIFHYGRLHVVSHPSQEKVGQYHKMPHEC